MGGGRGYFPERMLAKEARRRRNLHSLFRLHAERLHQERIPFFFYSNDHEPLHVHVRKGGGEAVFDVEPRVRLRESAGMKTADILRAEELAREHRPLIISKWHEHFD